MPVFEGSFTPSDLWPDGSQGAADFGRLAEIPINADFIQTKKCTPLADAYFDTPAVSLYIAFLISHNSHLRTPLKKTELETLSQIKGGMRRPDMLLHQSEEKAWYEIKGDSQAGRLSGLRKNEELAAFYRDWKLPYVRGTAYATAVISKKLTGGSRFATGIARLLTRNKIKRIDLELTWHRTEAGLVQYKVRVTIEFDGDLTELEFIFLAGFVVNMLIADQNPEHFPTFPWPQGGIIVDELAPGLVPIRAKLMQEILGRRIDAVPGVPYVLVGDAAALELFVTAPIRQRTMAMLRQLAPDLSTAVRLAPGSTAWVIASMTGDTQLQIAMVGAVVLVSAATAAGAAAIVLAPELLAAAPELGPIVATIKSALSTPAAQALVASAAVALLTFTATPASAATGPGGVTANAVRVIRRDSLKMTDQGFSIGDPVSIAGQSSQNLFCLGKIRFS